MPFNQIKKYDEFLELNHLSSKDRDNDLREIFNRDISENNYFLFRKKIIRPLKKEDKIDVESLFTHLTHQTSKERDKKGALVKSRNVFDIERSKRLHWILPHIKEKITLDDVKIFSAEVKARKKRLIRTFIYNEKKNYVIILEPQRSKKDYYFITAYYLEKKYGGPKTIKKAYKRRLNEVL